jgi:cytochrome c oxidase subunit II
MWENLPLWPAQASTMAGRVDALYVFLILVTGTVSLLVWLMIFIFAVKYRHKKHPKAEPIEGSTPLEITWSVLPLFVFMVFYGWGAAIYFAESRPPKNAMDVYVTGKQWMWKTQHVTGQREINELHVPAGRDVRLTLISQDVIHSFFIPAFRVKMDVIPGRYSTEWFHATKPGRYHLFCAEYCGTQHSGMIGEVTVMEPRDFEAWLAGGSGEGSMASTGQKLFQELGCATCHRFDVQGRGPNLMGIYGKPQLLADGRTITVDDNYIRESILNPGAKVVAGFQPIMPTFNGIVGEDQLLSLMAYVKSLQSASGPGTPVTPAREPVPGTAQMPAGGNAQPQQ